MMVLYNISWPSGQAHWTQALGLGSSPSVVSLSKTLNHCCFVPRMGHKATVCCVIIIILLLLLSIIYTG